MDILNPVLIVDTREHQNVQLERRIAGIGWPFRREKLPVGDYSAEIVLQEGCTVSLADRVCLERKASLEEVSESFGKERDRMMREIWRARDSGIRLYLLIENASWRRIRHHGYRSRMNPKALEGTLRMVQERYGVILVLCEDSTDTPGMIRNILLEEVKQAAAAVGTNDLYNKIHVTRR